MKISNIEIASAPLFLLSARLRTLLEAAFGCDIDWSQPLTCGVHIRKVLNAVCSAGFEFSLAGYENLPEKCCGLRDNATGLKFEVWGQNTEEAILRAAGLAALHTHRKNQAAA